MPLDATKRWYRLARLIIKVVEVLTIFYKLVLSNSCLNYISFLFAQMVFSMWVHWWNCHVALFRSCSRFSQTLSNASLAFLWLLQLTRVNRRTQVCMMLLHTSDYSLLTALTQLYHCLPLKSRVLSWQVSIGNQGSAKSCVWWLAWQIAIVAIIRLGGRLCNVAVAVIPHVLSLGQAWDWHTLIVYIAVVLEGWGAYDWRFLSIEWAWGRWTGTYLWPFHFLSIPCLFLDR